MWLPTMKRPEHWELPWRLERNSLGILDNRVQTRIVMLCQQLRSPAQCYELLIIFFKDRRLERKNFLTIKYKQLFRMQRQVAIATRAPFLCKRFARACPMNAHEYSIRLPPLCFSPMIRNIPVLSYFSSPASPRALRSGRKGPSDANGAL